jgi:hypothetical protein
VLLGLISVSRSYSCLHNLICGLRRCVRWGFRQSPLYSYEVYPTKYTPPYAFLSTPQRLKLVNRTHYPYNDVRRPHPNCNFDVCLLSNPDAMNERAPVIVDITIGMVKYAFLLVNNLQDSPFITRGYVSPLNQYLFVFVRPLHLFSIKVSSVSFISLTGRGLLHEAILLYQKYCYSLYSFGKPIIYYYKLR